jgi:hypothetical protein
VQDDEEPVRAKIREIAEGKIVTIVMMLVTIYALIGDDFRAWFFDKRADPYFYGGLCFSLLAFTAEIMVNSCVVDEFKWSFFFWLDIVATISLILDIEWIMNALAISIGNFPLNEGVDVHFGEI